MRAVNEKFVDLGLPRRIWAVAAVRGDLDRLCALHDHLAARFAVGDRIVYLGDYLGGSGRENAAILDELLAFRAAILAKPGMEPADIVHLRGPAEEAWQRLLRLQFAPVPTQSIERLLDAGVESYLRLYNISLQEARSIARAGSVAITRWTNNLRVLQRQNAGHEPLASSMRRAAVTRAFTDDAEKTPTRQVLFVPAGYDSLRSLEDQGDQLWFTTGAFALSGRAAAQYARIIRGVDPSRSGVETDGQAVTLDANCGRGGPLVCGCFAPLGRLTDIVAIGGTGAVETLRMDEKAPAPVLAAPKASAKALSGTLPAQASDSASLFG